MLFCPECGQKNEKSFNFCGSCGCSLKPNIKARQVIELEDENEEESPLNPEVGQILKLEETHVGGMFSRSSIVDLVKGYSPSENASMARPTIKMSKKQQKEQVEQLIKFIQPGKTEINTGADQ